MPQLDGVSSSSQLARTELQTRSTGSTGGGRTATHAPGCLAVIREIPVVARDLVFSVFGWPTGNTAYTPVNRTPSIEDSPANTEALARKEVFQDDPWWFVSDGVDPANRIYERADNPQALRKHNEQFIATHTVRVPVTGDDHYKDLDALYLPPKVPGGPVIIFSGGQGSHLENRIAFMEAWHDKGFGVMTYRPMGCESQSGEHRTEERLHASIEAAADYVTQQGVSIENQIVWGVSWGSPSAIYLASLRQEQCKSLIIQAGTPGLALEFAAKAADPRAREAALGKYAGIFDASTKPVAAQALVLHGNDDRWIPASLTEHFERMYQGHVTVNRFDGEGHGIGYQRYTPVVEAFLAKTHPKAYETPGYDLFGLETRGLLHLPSDVHGDDTTRVHLRSGAHLHDAHPLSKLLAQYESLEAPDRALKMSAALLAVPIERKRGPAEALTQDVGVEWNLEASDRFMDRLHEDMTKLKTERPDMFERAACNLLQAWPLLRNETLAGSMSEHAAFALAAECLEQQPDKWLGEMLQREPQWLEHAAELAADSVGPHAVEMPVSSRVAAVLSGEALSVPRRLQAHTAMAIAMAEACLACVPNDAAHDTALERARALTKKAIAGAYGHVPTQRWRELSRLWATLIRYVGDPAVLREFSASPADWSTKCLRPLNVEMRRFAQSALATKEPVVALEVATACLEALRPTPHKLLAGPAQLALLRIAEECVAMADTWYSDTKALPPQPLVALGSCAEALSFEPGSSRAKTLGEVTRHLGRLACWLLLRAEDQSDWATIDLLKAHGFDLHDQTTSLIGHHLRRAVMDDRVDAVRKLLDLGVDVNKDSFGKRSLHKARSVQMVDLLVERGANVLVRNSDNKLPSEVAANEDVRARLIELEQAASG
ncbi:MAG TPA: alpha/beta fold hydrolase [Albitalea sp.]|uniref:alpha/beta fold hydrolase n=1 Tax=Piscinibacter sp. TaxID=1903157 RepID=UPI002ECFC983